MKKYQPDQKKKYTKLKKKVIQNLKLFTPNPKTKNNTPN